MQFMKVNRLTKRCVFLLFFKTNSGGTNTQQINVSLFILHRHARLASLLTKLRNLMCAESKLTLSPEKTHPIALTTTAVAEIKLNKVRCRLCQSATHTRHNIRCVVAVPGPRFLSFLQT